MRASAVKPSWEAVGPLKRTDIRQSDNKTLDRTRPGVPSGTVADMSKVQRLDPQQLFCFCAIRAEEFMYSLLAPTLASAIPKGLLVWDYQVQYITAPLRG